MDVNIVAGKPDGAMIDIVQTLMTWPVNQENYLSIVYIYQKE
jgi:hypothetical protein